MACLAAWREDNIMLCTLLSSYYAHGHSTMSRIQVTHKGVKRSNYKKLSGAPQDDDFCFLNFMTMT